MSTIQNTSLVAHSTVWDVNCPTFCKISVSSWTRLHVSFLLCPAFLTLADRLYTFAPKPNCRAHSFRVPRGHCPLQSRRIVTLSLGDVVLIRRFCFGLRGSSSNIRQPARSRIHRQGRNTGYSAREHTERTQRSQGTRHCTISPKVCSLQTTR